MARIIVLVAAAVAIFALLWFLLWGVLHTIIIAFWIILVVLLGVGLFRIGRWSRRGTRQ